MSLLSEKEPEKFKKLCLVQIVAFEYTNILARIIHKVLLKLFQTAVKYLVLSKM